MIDPQSWPSGTHVSHQTFAGGRLRFIRDGAAHRPGPRLEFEFTRAFSDVTLHPILPPVRFFGPSIRSHIPVSQHPYHTLVHHNHFLRNRHPDIDLPKSILLEYLLEDQDLPEQIEPLQSSLLTGLAIDEQHNVIISAGGSLGNELYCSLLLNDHSKAPSLHITPNPAITLRTPVQQLTSGPSMSSAADAAFLARTHDSTTLFTYSLLSRTNSYPQIDHSHLLPSPKTFAFGVGHQLKTSDTNHEIHIDACVGHTIDDTYRQFIVLNSKGQLWKVSGIGGNGSIRRVGTLSYPSPHRLMWGRCGINPSNDSLVVGLRHSVSIVDHRLIGECSHLYSVSNGNQITDIQRYINNQSPHLRLINTTSSIICLDDRKPGIPMLDIKHFRAPDLTLSMSFSAEPEWSPQASYSLSTAGERFDKVLLWSRVNDVASFHQLKFHPAIPPSILGHPSAVPLVSSAPSNRRAGLIFFRRKAIDDHPEKLCLIELKRDGSLWHQQLALLAFDHSLPSTDSITKENKPLYPAGAEATGVSVEKIDSQGGSVQIPYPSLNLAAICQDFTETYLSNFTSATHFQEGPLSSLDPTNPLSFCTPSQSSNLQSKKRRNVSNPSSHRLSVANSIIDLTPVLESLLSGSTAPPANDKEMVDKHRTGPDRETRRMLDNILVTATDLFKKTQALSSGQKDSELNTHFIADNQRSIPTVIDRLMEGWKIGVPTNKHKWKDICSTIPGAAFDLAEAESDHYSEASPPIKLGHRNGLNSAIPSQKAFSREPTIDIAKAFQYNYQAQPSEPLASQLTPPKLKPSQISPTTSCLSPGLGNPSLTRDYVDIPVDSTSQPNPQISHSNSPSGVSTVNQASSQLISGPHATRRSSRLNQSKKKKRIGGF